jgi:hypothetical protein
MQKTTLTYADDTSGLRVVRVNYLSVGKMAWTDDAIFADSPREFLASCLTGDFQMLLLLARTPVRLTVKCPVIFLNINENWNVSTNFSEIREHPSSCSRFVTCDLQHTHLAFLDSELDYALSLWRQTYGTKRTLVYGSELPSVYLLNSHEAFEPLWANSVLKHLNSSLKAMP